MCTTTIATLLGLAAGCAAPLAPADLLAPVDPGVATRWHAPPSPVAGLKRYAPVEASSHWGDGPLQPETNGGGGMPGMNMPGMKMDVPGMDMPGMGGK